MVAWLFQLFTPEYPAGREIVVIANDITVSIGSFGPTEDLLFYKASEYARTHGLPRIYISANSGARIGLAEELQKCFQVAWNDVNNPAKGFKYLYLSTEDYERFCANAETPSAITEKIVEDGETRYKIVDIVGQTHGLGVENLQGSGMIAGETSKAYRDIFTVTLVTCRSVGIGAYLVRLGQRAIQIKYQPIILTGAAALNKVLGREVYTSNLQLGGTQIMVNNGVSHLAAENDMQGIQSILNWLAFVPHKRDALLPMVESLDPYDRDIDVELASNADVRGLLAGQADDSGKWMSGFFDKGSFIETLSGWAKGVIVGRARLGGIPMGVIAVETRSTETIIPADPASPDSNEQKITEAGQVWYPNSAYKTAQAIRDFNHGEQLPLMIFANWRGFSGGQSDMYKEVLKYGSLIVDALVEYRQPVFIYVTGELRGGAWVVLDPTINPDMMEMYAETNARGGVLEAQGTVEIKFRKPQLLSTMERLDPRYASLKTELQRLAPQDIAPSPTKPSTKPMSRMDTLASSASSTLPPRPATQFPSSSSTTRTASLTNGDSTNNPHDQIQKELETLESTLLPVYHQVALSFADLHDTSGRMKAKQAVSDVIPWHRARTVFYHRLKLRVCEESVLREMKAVVSREPVVLSLTRSAALGLLKKWFKETSNTTDEYVRWLELSGSWLPAKMKHVVDEMKKQSLLAIVESDPKVALEGLLEHVQSLDEEAKKAILRVLKHT